MLFYYFGLIIKNIEPFQILSFPVVFPFTFFFSLNFFEKDFLITIPKNTIIQQSNTFFQYFFKNFLIFLFFFFGNLKKNFFLSFFQIFFFFFLIFFHLCFGFASSSTFELELSLQEFGRDIYKIYLQNQLQDQTKSKRSNLRLLPLARHRMQPPHLLLVRIFCCQSS